MYGIFTSVLWYLEFVAFALTLIGFFCFILYIAKINYNTYNIRYDFRPNLQDVICSKPTKPKISKQYQRPICFEPDCIWFCRLIGSIVTIALCYFCAYAFISDTKLKFGLFVP